MFFFLVFVLIGIIIVIRIISVRKIKALEQKICETQIQMRQISERISKVEREAHEYNVQEITPESSDIPISNGSKLPSSVQTPSELSIAHETKEDQQEKIYTEPAHNSKAVTSVISKVKASVPVHHVKPKSESISLFWQKLEKQIAENWTGILGTIVLVVGIGFLGVYTALKMTEFFRFLMIVACAVIMASVF